MTDRACPAWCTKTDCDGNHEGDAVSAADGVLITPGVDASLLVRPYHDQADGVPPEVYMADNWDEGSDWGFQMPVTEARRLGHELIDVADRIAPEK